MAVLTLLFAALGFLSPANRGSLMTTLLLLYVFMGIFAGYYSARCYKMFGETDWQRQTLQTALLFPGLNFLVFFALDLLVWRRPIRYYAFTVGVVVRYLSAVGLFGCIFGFQERPTRVAIPTY